jgi:hypothetical protein
MNYAIIKRVLTSIALLWLPGLGLADVKFNLKIQVGGSYISSGDVNRGTQALFDWERAFWPASQGGYRPVHSSHEFGGDIIFELNPTIGIGIGGGYLKTSRDSVMEVSNPDMDVTGWLLTEPKLSAIPIRLSLFLKFPLTAKINLNAIFGGSCYFQTRYSDDIRESSYTWANQLHGFYQITTRTEKKGAPLGFDGGIGIEYQLSRKLFLSFDAKGRYAKLRGLEGSSEFYDQFGELFEQGKLYYESVPILIGAPRLIMVQSSPPEGPDGTARQAVVDLSGVSLQAGIRIRL